MKLNFKYYFLYLYLPFFLVCLVQGLYAQNNFKKIDNYKIDKNRIEVFFIDPMVEIKAWEEQFQNLPDEDKFDKLLNYLYNNPLYIFKLTNKQGVKYYVIRGNPKKQRTTNYFQVDILKYAQEESFSFDIQEKYKTLLDKTISKVKVGGVLFENMYIFQQSQAKNIIGKGILFWGKFTPVVPYSTIKNEMNNLITLDLANKIPLDMIEDNKILDPLFEYQKCGINAVKERVIRSNIYQYDSVGKIKHEHSQIEKDNNLYYSSIGMNLLGVTSFPFFDSKDQIIDLGQNILQINSSLKNINHYLKDIKVFLSKDLKTVERIEAKLIIHSYGIGGESSYDELYVAEFTEVNNCKLPTIIKFCPIDDLEYKKPRLIMEITYKF